MNDKRYAKLALILAAISFFLSNLPPITPFLVSFFHLFLDIELPHQLFGGLAFLCLFPGLVIAFIAYKMGKRMKGSFTIINFARILSLLAILASLFWIIIGIMAPFLASFSPNW